MKQWQCRWAPSLGSLERTHQEVWGTKDYKSKKAPTVFFGLYGLPDFYALWRHEGEKHILWAGSDITHLKNGYWLDESGEIRVIPQPFCQWINKNCTNWVENQVEYDALKALGIESNIVPSYLGNMESEINWEPGNKLYTSVSGNNFELYGWDKIPELAAKNPNIEFHLYGNTEPFDIGLENVFVHGRVPLEQMMKETKTMQGALRLTKFDGFSEILARSVLWGQWPVSLIPYPHMLSIDQIKDIPNKLTPNFGGAAYYTETLNKFPWHSNI